MNKIIKKLNYAEIIINSKNKEHAILIDLEDIERVSKHHWFMCGNYAQCKIKRKNIYLHRFLLNPPEHMQVDHINRDTFDNRKNNLRICTLVENLNNRDIFNFKNSNKTISGKRYIYPSGKKWKVLINYGGKKVYMATFGTLFEAECYAEKLYNNLLWA